MVFLPLFSANVAVFVDFLGGAGLNNVLLGSGAFLSTGMGKYRDIFGEFAVNVVRVGEISGTLDHSLERIADQQEKDAEIASKVKGAMVYPGIVLLVIVGVIIFMLTGVVPQIQNLYTNLKRPLPFLTAIMVAMAQFLIHFWWLIIYLNTITSNSKIGRGKS